MKKHIFMLAVALLTAATAQAQVALRPYVGVNSSKLTGNLDTATFKNQVGFQIGADLQIGNKFYVQPGVQLEFRQNTIDPRVDEDQKLNRSMLRIPVVVGYSFGEVDGDFAFRVFTGPNAAINLSSKTDDGSIIEDEDIKSAIFGWNAGLGVDISIIFVDLGYEFGLSEVFENVDGTVRNNLFYANAGLRIRF